VPVNQEQAAVSHHRGRAARRRLRASRRALVARELRMPSRKAFMLRLRSWEFSLGCAGGAGGRVSRGKGAVG
jgi:hypothetical protein